MTCQIGSHLLLFFLTGTGTAFRWTKTSVKNLYNVRVYKNGQRPPTLPESPTIISMLHQGTDIEESHEDVEDDLDSLTWQEIAENNFVVFERVIEEFNVPENEGILPNQLLKVANDILYISLGIKVNYTNSSLLTYLYKQVIFQFSL